MDVFLVALDDVSQSDISRVGRKAATLGTLLKASFPVPRGVCVTVDAFRFAFAAYKPSIDAILDRRAPLTATSAQAAADEVAQLLANLTLPPELATTLRDALSVFLAEATPLAVRSSAIDEDRPDASFAGLYSSVIGVRGEEAIHAALLTCWRSFFGTNALLGRITHIGHTASYGMAVLIQPVIQAECAGVCFSIDPVQQRRDCAIVNAAWGLGIGVVDGSVATDIARVSWEDLSICEHHIALKQEHILLNQDGGLRRSPVMADRQRIACLPDTWLVRAAQFAISAALILQCPQDLEWAIAEDHLWVLQSRPITGLLAGMTQSSQFPVVWASHEKQTALWGREGRERHDDVLFPLEQDELIEVESTREETCRLLGVERNQQIKLVNGRVFARPIPVNWAAESQSIRRGFNTDLQVRLQREGLTTWDYWGPEIIKATEQLRTFDPALADDVALADHLADALAVRRHHYMLHPACSFQPPESYFDAYAAMTGTRLAEAHTAAYQILDVGETPLSRCIEHLYGLARTALLDAEVTALIVNPPHDVLTRLASMTQGRVFLQHLDRFLDEYGEHTGNGWGSEVLLRDSTWRERPETVLAFLRPFLDPEVESPAVTRRRVRQALENRVEALCTARKDPAAVQEFRRQWAYACKVHAVLEIHNHFIDQVSTGQLRHAVMAAGQRLASWDALDAADDVLWLYFDEILGALRASRSEPISFAEVIGTRKQQHAVWSSLQSPPFIGVPVAQLPERPQPGDQVTTDELDDPSVLVGQGASAGRFRGRARVIADMQSLPDLQHGDILISWNVGPAWLPLFPLLGGLILEGGSVGQHAAATAREYGLPAVVNVKHAIDRIPDGAWVTVDGASGTVILG